MVPETNMPVRFYLTPNREDGSASILVAEPLDYEMTRNFMLRVRAQNVAAVPLAAFTMVTVNVTGKLIFIFVNCKCLFRRFTTGCKNSKHNTKNTHLFLQDGEIGFKVIII